jgi:hypothetical protein
VLIPFSINENVVNEFRIPVHIIDWHRIRILKEVDDIRFMAVRDANIDLSMDALLALKFYKLCMMANPRFNPDGSVLSIDPASYCFDVTKEEIINAINEINDNTKKRLLIERSMQNIYQTPIVWKLDDTVNAYNQLRDNKLFLARLGVNKGAYEVRSIPDGPAYYTIAFKRGEVGPIKITPTLVKESASLIQTGTTLLSEKEIESIAFKETVLTPALYTTREWGKFPATSTTYKYISRTYSLLQYALDISSPYPKLWDALVVLADIYAYIYVNAELVQTLKYIYASPIVSEVDAGFAIVSEKNIYYSPIDSKTLVITTPSMKTPTGGSYLLPFTAGFKTFPSWYKLTKVTLQNGKSFTFPKSSLSWPDGNRAFANLSLHPTSILLWKQSRWQDYDGREPILENIKANASLYNFPITTPRNLITGDLQVRNGYLYADASNFYETAFFKFPESTIDKLATVITMMASVDSVLEDLADGTLVNEENLDASVGYRVTTTFFWEFGVKHPFVHPISLKPISAKQYIAEMTLEAAIAYDLAITEINAFVAPMKISNDYSFQKAYETFLRGEATMKGPEELALFEKRVVTGIFYSENGFQYWRAFTALELKVIEQMKIDSILNKEQSDKNAVVMIENKIYQDAANANAVKANEEKMAIAKIMAEAELKTIANNELAKMIVPTMEYLILRSESEGGVPSDSLSKWVNENPYYYLRPDTEKAVSQLSNDLTFIESRVATALVADVVAEIEFTNALKELFTFK